MMTQTAFRTKKSLQTFEHVLTTATRLFREKGYVETTMRDISRESKLGLGALYYYFRSKEEIVLRFYEQTGDRAVTAYRNLPETPKKLPEAVAAFLRLRIELLTPYRGLLHVVLREAVDPSSQLSPLHPASRATLDQIVGVFREMVETTGAAKGKEAQEMARALWLGQIAILFYW